MTPELIALFLAQAAREAANEALYFTAEYWARFRGWPGSQAFFGKNSLEERTHSRELLDFVCDYADLPVGIPARPEVQAGSWATLPEVLGAALQRELENTLNLEALYAASEKARDVVAMRRVGEMLDEQRDSVIQFRDLARRAVNTQNNPAALMELDEYLGEL